MGSVTRTSVALTWGPSTDNVGVSGYRVYVNGAGVADPTQPGATVSALVCGTAFTFEVDAADAAGNRSTRARVTASTSPCADTQAPTTPSDLAASSRTATSIALTWTASTDNVGVTSYGLYRGGTSAGSSATTTGIFSGLVCNTNYTLAVDAQDAAGNRSGKGDRHGRHDRVPGHGCTFRSHRPRCLQRHAVERDGLLAGLDGQRRRRRL